MDTQVSIPSARRPVFRGNVHDRAEEKWRLVSAYLMRWHFSSNDILVGVMGLSNKGSAATLHRWVKAGLLHKLVTEYSDSRPVYLLTATGKDEAHRAVFPHLYATSPSRMRWKEVLHDLAVQRAALRFEPAEIVPARLFKAHLRLQMLRRLHSAQEAHSEVNAEVLELLSQDHWRAVELLMQRQQGSWDNSTDAVALIRAHEHNIGAGDLARLRELLERQDQVAAALDTVQDEAVDGIRGKEPDALVIQAGEEPLALEVERTAKNYAKLAVVFKQHLQKLESGVYARVVYLCRSEALKCHLENALLRLLRDPDVDTDRALKHCFTFQFESAIF